MRSAYVLAVVLSLLGPSSAFAMDDAPAKPLRIAVYDFDVSGVDERVARVVMSSLVTELRKLQRASVIGMDDLRAMLDLEAQKQLAGCEDESCLAEIADALGADALVVGTVARIEDQHVFGLRRIDQRRAEVAAAVNYRLEAGSGEELLAVIGPAVAKLFPDHPLRPGMERGVAKELALRLNPPPLPVWSFWAGAGAAGTAAVVGGVLGAVSVVLARDYEALLAESASRTVDGAELKERQQLATSVTWSSWGAFGGAAALVAATGVLALFVDWQGYGAEVE